MNRSECMNCRSERLKEFIDLGEQPNGNNFLFPEEADDQLFFELKMLVCLDCWEVQIDEFPSPEFMFSNHPYISGVNVPVVRHFSSLAVRVVDKLELDENSLVIDVGCNDGSLLRAFERCGMRTLGVDPGKRTGELARKQGKVVFETFFSEKTGKALSELGIRPDVVTATAVFYHIPDLHDFVRGLNWLMTDESVFVVQCVGIRDLIQKNEFDHFYHEHSCIHGVSPLKRLFEEFGLKIFDVEHSEIHGGSFILYVAKLENKAVIEPSVDEYIESEKSAGLDNFDTYWSFSERVGHNAAAVKSFLQELKANGKSVYALGAPVKGSTFLNFAGIDSDLVSCATEVNEFKIGRLVPGTSIPVVDERDLEQMPDYFLVLSWNFLDFLVEKYDDYLRSGGKFIVGVPELRVVER